MMKKKRCVEFKKIYIYKNGRHEQSCVRDPGTTFFSPREKFRYFIFSSQFSVVICFS